MDLKDAAQAWQTDGFVILPGFLPAEELTSAVGELDLLFPSADGFHDGTDPRRERFTGDEFAGIDTFLDDELLAFRGAVEMYVFLNDVPPTSSDRRTSSSVTTPPTCPPFPTGCCGRAKPVTIASWPRLIHNFTKRKSPVRGRREQSSLSSRGPFTAARS